MIRHGAVLFLLLLVASAALAQQHPNEDRGFSPEKVFQFGDLDHVNTYNGNRVITIPLGPSYPVGGGLSYGLKLFYSGNPWDYEEVMPCVISYPNRRSNAGLGWQVSLGRLIPPQNETNETANTAFVYESADGSDHPFYNSLHGGSADPSGIWYTRDSTYHRLLPPSTQVVGGTVVTERVVESPDGLRHTFRQGASAQEIWKLQEIADRSGNRVTVSYSSPLPYAEVWTISDNHNRQQKVYFKQITASGWTYRFVDKVELSVWTSAAATATYSFTYTVTTLQYGPKDYCHTAADGFTRTTSQIPLLTQLTMPEGLVFKMTGTDGLPAYGTSGYDSGNLRALVLPTGGRIEWDMALYDFPRESVDYVDVPGDPMGRQRPDGGRIDRAFSLGVLERRKIGANNEVIGRWKYRQLLSVSESCSNGFTPVHPGPRQSVTLVTMPDGVTTRLHYYNVFTDEGCSTGWQEKEFSDSGTRYVQDLVDDRTLFLASELRSIPQGTSLPLLAPQGRVPAGTLLESEFVENERDDIADRFATNDRVRTRRTKYDADTSCGGVCFRDERMSGFDGFGNYRQTSFRSNFFAGDYQTSFSNVQAPGTAWILGLSTEQCASETFELGTHTSCSSLTTRTTHATSCFDAATGLLKGNRVCKNTAAEGPNDVMALFAYVSGNRTSEKWFGGDSGSVPSSGICATTAETPQYELVHDYSGGVPVRSRYVSGSSTVLETLDRTIDVPSALTISQRDPADLQTTFTYDLLGRPKTTQLAGFADTIYTWTAPSPSAPAKVRIESKAGTQRMAASEVIYDSLGRVSEEKKLLPDEQTGEQWSLRLTEYDPSGRKWREWATGATAAHFTELTYDPFGRVQRIERPDHSFTTVDYGNGFKARVTTVKNADGSTTTSSTERYDGRGRLREIRQAGGTGADYTYDVANRLKRVEVLGSPANQVRTFVYDGRGFLASDTHPEQGASGYLYDARGHVLAKSTADCYKDLRYGYDAAERLVTVEMRNQYNDCATNTFWPLKEFEFATANSGGDWRNGKLVRSVRHNQLELVGDVVVTEEFFYGGVAGSMSTKKTIVEKFLGASRTPLQEFQQSYTYDSLGQVTRLEYPSCLLVPCGQATSQDVTRGYSNAALTSVGGFATLRYHPNGMVREIAHGNGVTETIAKDPHDMPRPASFTFSSLSDCASLSLNASPLAQTIQPGQSANLSVTVNAGAGAGLLSYQWYQGGTAAIAGQTGPTFTTPALQSTTTYTVEVWSSCRRVMSQVMTVTVSAVLAAPQSLQATATGTTAVSVSWSPVNGASSYRVEARYGGAAYQLVGTVLAPTTSYTHNASPGTSYVYRVQAIGSSASSPFSNQDLATTIIYSPPTGAIQLAHFNQLLTSLNAIRAAKGDSSLSWASILPGGVAAPAIRSQIDSEHLERLRIHTDAALVALGLPVPPYGSGSGHVLAENIRELQERAQ